MDFSIWVWPIVFLSQFKQNITKQNVCLCFHAKCIDSLLLKMPIFPICRTCAKPPKIGVVLGEGSSISDDYAIELT